MSVWAEGVWAEGVCDEAFMIKITIAGSGGAESSFFPGDKTIGGTLGIHDTDGSHFLVFKAGSNLTADRELRLVTGDAPRVVTLDGDPTLDDWFDQPVQQDATPRFARMGIGADAHESHPLVVMGGNVGIGTAGPDEALHVAGGYIKIGDHTKGLYMEDLFQGFPVWAFRSKNDGYGDLLDLMGWSGVQFTARNGPSIEGGTVIAHLVLTNALDTATRRFGFRGTGAGEIRVDRHPTADTAGNPLTVTSGGATSGANDKAGGNLILASGISTGNASSNIVLQTSGGGSSGSSDKALAEVMRITGTGKVGIGQDSPAAVLHLAAGTASPNTAPLKFASGTLLTTPEAGAIEFDGDNLYFSDSGGTRRQLAVV